MIKGIGVDIIEIDRIAALQQRQPSFQKRILTDLECEQIETLSSKRKIEFLAGRFASKEAFSKALGTGIGQEVSWQDVSIINTELGAPRLIWHQQKDLSNLHIHLSISHSKHYVVAQVIIEEDL